MNAKSSARTLASLLTGLALLWLLGWGLGAIVHGVATGQTFEVDRPVLDFLVDQRSGLLTAAMRALTFMGGFPVLLPVVAVTGVTWWLARHTLRPLVFLSLGYGGSASLTDSIKAIVDRPRPIAADAIGQYSGASFPSGHALDAMAVYGALAILVTQASRTRPAKIVAWWAALVLVAAVAFTRLYLGAHWLTDVLAGIVLGSLWLAVLAALLRSAVEPSDASPASRSASGPPP